MAPPPDHVYFPPLGELLDGERVLLSWKLVASSLADGTGHRLSSRAVADFLADPFVVELLKAPSTAFSPPTPQTATALETRTAAINVVPAVTDRYDVKAIQADAQWLSRCVNINEVAALRLVVVELQARSQAFLATPLSSQDVTNIHKAAVGSNATAIAAEATADADDLWSAFGRAENQRQRLLATYLSERRSFAMAVDHVTSVALHGLAPRWRSASGTAAAAAAAASVSASADDAAERETVVAAIDALRTDLVKGFLGESDAAAALAAPGSGAGLAPGAYLGSLPALIAELRACIGRTVDGIEGTVKNKQGLVLTPVLAVEWVQTALAEAVHYMSVVFLALTSSGGLFLPAAHVADWFRFMGEYGFLDGLVPVDDAMAELILPLKTLSCVNSLVCLNLNRAIGYLDHDLDLQNDEEPYVNDSDVLEVIHDAILRAAEAGLPTASPLFLAWSLILHRMDISYQERAERRDLAQNQRAQDGFELDVQSPQLQALQPRGRRSSVGSIVSIEAAKYDAFLSERVLTTASSGEDPLVPRLARLATDQGLVYDVISAMATGAGSSTDSAFRPDLGARVRVVFLDVLKASFPIIGYQAEPLSALLAVLSGSHQMWNEPQDDETVARTVLEDDALWQFYFGNALSRFPYEFSPFLSMCRYLSTCIRGSEDVLDTIRDTLFQTPTLTFTLPAGFEGYAMIDDADHATATMQTVEDIPLFPFKGRRRQIAYGNERGSAVVPAGTFGRFMIDGSGIVNLDYEHSTVALLGQGIDASLNRNLYEPVLGHLEAAEVADVIRLLTALVRAEIRKQGSDASRAADAGLAVLQEASRDLDQAKDILTVIFDTLDVNIQDGPTEKTLERMAVLAACMEFLHAVLPLCPGRIWSYMARCQLLNTESSAGRLCILTGASDVLAERFDFLMASTRFLSGLVDNAASSAVQRRVLAAKPTARSNHQQHKAAEENIWLGASDKTLEQVSLSVAQTVVDVYENTSTWKFASEVHRSSLVAGTVGILRDIVVYASSLEAPTEPQQSLVGCFETAAEFVVRSFLASSSSSLRFQPLLTSLMLGQELPQSTLYLQRRQLGVDRVTSVLNFAGTLLKVAHQVEATGRAPAFETNLFQIATLPARLCASEATVRPALSLLTDLVVTAAARASEPPSLLGYLGPHIARSFLGVLSAMDKPFKRPTEAARIWKFFSTILRHRQQWMANSLLTGKTPREALQTDGKTTKPSKDSALIKAKDILRSIKTTPDVEILAVLDFFAAAQNYWPWAIFAIRSENDYLESMLAYVRDLEPASTRARTDPQAACSEARIAAYVAESLAMQLYHMRQMGTDEVFARDVVKSIDYYLRDGVRVAGYNASLHGNFQRNFANRYAGCSLDLFKRSMLQRRDLGTQFYYALDLADKMLSFDGGWTGVRDSNKGFKKEMQTANLNLSLVDAQIALYHAWEVLLLELSVCLLPQNLRLPVLMVQLAEQCLTANQDSHGPELVFVKLAQSRANLALLLLQRLAEYALLPADVSSLLRTVWTSIQGMDNPWSREQAPYYRTLLRILYLVLCSPRKGGRKRREQGSSGTSDGNKAAAAAAGDGGAKDAQDAKDDKGENGAMVVSTTQTVLNVLDRVVARGFRTLAGMVHDKEAESRPEDMALLTGVLQACLNTAGLRECQTQVLNIMMAHDALHVATSLFSWADKLLVDDRDPVYGELSLLFLLELSTLPVVAEQLACDGFLSHLTSAGLASHMRRGHGGVALISPFSDVAASQRCYSIWVKALLPLLLNILIALGTSVAPEIAFVLNQFPLLLEASVQRIEAPGMSRTSGVLPVVVPGGPSSSSASNLTSHLTLLAVNEVHSLALLTRVLELLRVNHARDIPEVRRWDGAAVLESIDFWLSRPKLLRERLVPLGPREAEWRATAPQHSKGLVENRLEEKVILLLDATRTILSDEEAE